MKRLTLGIGLLVAMALACNFSTMSRPETIATPSPAPDTKSEKRCGDDVCDEPENAENCPADCSPGGETRDDSGEDDADITPTDDKTDENLALAYLHARAVLDREMGVGDCGVDPWRSEACQNIAPTKWWGQHLAAQALTPLLIIPDGEGRWVITNHPDTVVKYGYDATTFEAQQASYQEATINFSITPECSGEIEGQNFDFQVMGTYEAEMLELILSANPQEHITGNCAGTAFEQHPTHLLYGWAAALSGDPLDLTGVLDESHHSAVDPGTYEHLFVTDTNPSPDNRDHVEARLTFQCVEALEGSVKTPTACPWEK